MERQPDPQQVQVITVQPRPASIARRPRVKIALLLFFTSLWPWFWIWFGLYKIQDYRLTMVLYEIMCCTLPVFFFGRESAAFRPLNMRKRWLILLILLANVYFLSFFKLSHGATLEWQHFLPHMRTIKLTNNPEFWAYGAFLVLFNPIFEECFWRGTVYREWKTLVSPRAAMLISAFFFGAWHWIVVQYFAEPLWAIVMTFIVMLGGVIFSFTYEKTGTLGASMLMHGLGADFPILFIVHAAMLHATGHS